MPSDKIRALGLSGFWGSAPIARKFSVEAKLRIVVWHPDNPGFFVGSSPLCLVGRCSLPDSVVSPIALSSLSHDSYQHLRQEAIAQAKKIPPKCMALRWGSTGLCEERLIAVGQQRFARVLLAVLGKGHGVGDVPLDGRPAVIDDISHEEERAYRLKMGQWRMAACEVVQDEMFWALLRLSFVTRAPLDHFYAFMRQKEPSTDDAGSFGHYATLACGSSRQHTPDSMALPRKPRDHDGNQN